MRVLHLFSNSKWTGPAEPALNLCVALRELGVHCDWACSPGADIEQNRIVATARERGLSPILSLALHKHRRPAANWRDSRKLRRILSTCAYDLVHCHLDNDHRIAVGPAQRAGVPVVRSNYGGEGFDNPHKVAKLLNKTAFVVEPSQRALAHDAKTFNYPREQMDVVPGAVDTNRFDPDRPVPDLRARLGIPGDAFVAGIVARMQLHRHFEAFWDGVAELIHAEPEARIVVVGRGTNQERVGFEPVRARGLTDHVHFTGYLDGDEYVGALRAFTAKVFLVPGTDGTCRAVREAMAMGKPAVVADRGMLAEIVEHGRTGLVFDGSAPALAEALKALARDPARAAALGEAARNTAANAFSLPAQAQQIRAIYQQVCAR